LKSGQNRCQLPLMDTEVSEILLREIENAFEHPNNWWNKTP
jgi:hypothetical protein